MALQPEQRGLLILGNGQLGTTLAPGRLLLTPYWSTVPVVLLDHAALDLTDAAAVARAHCGAASWVRDQYRRVQSGRRRGEQALALAFAVNASGVAFVAARRRAGLRALRTSAPTMFSLVRPAAGVPVPYREEDRPAPRSVYGVSKLAGEHLARAYAPGALVIRTCGIYGPRHNRLGKRSFVEAILHQAQSGNASGDSGGRPILRVVSDQRVCPTYAADLARAILQLLWVLMPRVWYTWQAPAPVHGMNSPWLSWSLPDWTPCSADSQHSPRCPVCGQTGDLSSTLDGCSNWA